MIKKIRKQHKYLGRMSRQTKRVHFEIYLLNCSNIQHGQNTALESLRTSHLRLEIPLLLAIDINETNFIYYLQFRKGQK